VFAVLASVGIILGAAYLLWMYQRTMFQELKNKKWLKVSDLSAREIITLVPLAGLAVFIGVYPAPLLNLLAAPAQNIVAQVQPYMAEYGGSFLKLAGSIFGGGF
jgi:NADH-quinone oxidoreductase subunit M